MPKSTDMIARTVGTVTMLGAADPSLVELTDKAGRIEAKRVGMT